MADHLLIFLDELYGLDGTQVYGNHSWLIYALEVARNFNQASLFLTVKSPPPRGWPRVAKLTESPVRLLPLPPYGSLVESFLRSPAVFQHFYRHLEDIRQATALLIRVPSLMGLVLAEMGQALGKTVCFYVCGNLETSANPIARGGPGLPLWRGLARGVTRLTQWSARRSIVFTVGAELADIYATPPHLIPSPVMVFNVPNPMYSETAVHERPDTCQGEVIRLMRVCPINPNKGIEVLLHCLAILVERGFPVELDIAGGGAPEYLEELQGLAAKLGLLSRVRFLGHLEFGEVMHLYRKADIQVISSLGEGVPRVVMEGWSASLPLVSTEVGGIPGLVQQEHTGLLVPPSDPQALADAVERIIKDKGLRQRLIQNGFAVARENSREKQAARLAAIIKEYAQSQKRLGNGGKEGAT